MRRPARPRIWKLEEFIESPGNRVAFGAARAMLQDVGQVYNPLVIIGGSGTGKTHLLQRPRQRAGGSSRLAGRLPPGPGFRG